MAIEQIEPLKIREELGKTLPPDYWEREVFENVVVLGRDLTSVADDYHQTRAEARQMVGKVRDWLMNAPDDETGDLPPEKARRLAARVVRMRLEKLMSIAMECFEDSRGTATIEKVRNLGTERIEETIRRPAYGDLRYLTHYRQVALVAARLDGVCLRPETQQQPDRDEREAQAAWMEARNAQDLAEERREVLFEERAARRKQQVRQEMAEEAVLERQQAEELAAFIAAVEQSRATRGEGAITEEQLAHESDLYTYAQSALQGDRDARQTLAEIAAATGTCDAEAERKSAATVVREVQKTTYKTLPPVPANASVKERRRAFLSGAPIGDVA